MAELGAAHGGDRPTGPVPATGGDASAGRAAHLVERVVVATGPGDRPQPVSGRYMPDGGAANGTDNAPATQLDRVDRVDPRLDPDTRRSAEVLSAMGQVAAAREGFVEAWTGVKGQLADLRAELGDRAGSVRLPVDGRTGEFDPGQVTRAGLDDLAGRFADPEKGRALREAGAGFFEAAGRVDRAATAFAEASVGYVSRLGSGGAPPGDGLGTRSAEVVPRDVGDAFRALGDRVEVHLPEAGHRDNPRVRDRETNLTIEFPREGGLVITFPADVARRAPGTDSGRPEFQVLDGGTPDRPGGVPDRQWSQDRPGGAQDRPDGRLEGYAGAVVEKWLGADEGGGSRGRHPDRFTWGDLANVFKLSFRGLAGVASDFLTGRMLTNPVVVRGVSRGRHGGLDVRRGEVRGAEARELWSNFGEKWSTGITPGGDSNGAMPSRYDNADGSPRMPFGVDRPQQPSSGNQSAAM